MITRNIFMSALTANMVHYFVGACEITELLASAGYNRPLSDERSAEVENALKDASECFFEYLNTDPDNNTIVEALYVRTAEKITNIVWR